MILTKDSGDAQLIYTILHMNLFFWQFSYMYDIEWLRQQFKPADRNKPMTLVEGLKGDSRVDLLEQRGNYTNIKIVQVG